MIDISAIICTLGQNAVRRVMENFDIDVVVRDTIKLYNQVIEGRK